METATSIARAIEIAIAATAETTDEAVAEIAPETADAHDEALLDMVAAEMGAPDLSDDSEYYDAALAEMEAAEIEAAETRANDTGAAEMQAADPEPDIAEIETTTLAPRAATPLPTVQPVSHPSFSQPPSERASEPSPAVTPEPSLGSTLIANGLVSKPSAASDPLAALRRLSQVEKIALFS